MEEILNIGFGNAVVASRIVAVVSSQSAPIKRLREEAKRHNHLIDATAGRQTRSVIITDSDHVILSSVQVATLISRLAYKNQVNNSD
jgi:regulator of extracellular matrix RemA (YlzA/DUF370 family)